MRNLTALVAIFLFLTVSAFAGGFIELAGESKIPLAEGWRLNGDNVEYPFQIVNEDLSAELLIYKSTISTNEIIENEQELKLSVDDVIEDVIMTLPDAILLTSTGYFDQNRVWFALDFVSYEAESEVQLQQRLKGVIYKHPDGHQVLFSLWAKVVVGSPPSIMNELRLMQDEFAYVGEAERQIFGQGASYDWYLIGFLFIVLIAMMFVLKKQRQDDKIAFSTDGNFWRCECGRLNHNDNVTCRRCGSPQETEPVN